MTLRAATSTTVRLARRTRGTDSLHTVAAAASRIQHWAATAEGRRRTAEVLRSMDHRVWRVTQHVRLPDGTHADHLAVGPTGCYLLASRAWPGVVTVDHKGATITPDGHPGAAWTARGQHRSFAPAAAALGRSVAARGGGMLPPPRAVVVVWARFPDRLALSGGISYVAGELLAGWLSGRTAPPDQRVPRRLLDADPLPAPASA
ncbi:nuclease-related domain-containing protein [Blastococcus tunisiensis]|uniref:Nuclease-related domain-containing protein n=1 Tax=Blastococcus tunisiensis TaxID=1798228 RepID=A0A1I1XBB4_9ACTN|nr:nuclease-related domain-containing protein [Blastococcus sp. DSM 46838]SFE04706.1 Nuclease-related domain-containing protein [Blastococcus sp. DSM 46838]